MTLNSAMPDSGTNGRGFANVPFYLALGAIHFYFVAYFISLVQIPRVLEGEADWLIGLVVGALGLSGMAARPLSGVLVDSGRRQLWLRVGAVGTVLTFAGYALSADPWVMLGFRLLHGVAMALFTTSLLAMVTGMLPERSRGLGVGVYQSANAVAQLYAAVLAVALTGLTSFEFVFMVGAVSSLLAGLFGLFIVERVRPLAASLPWRRRQWISRSGLAPAIVFCAMTTTFGAVQAFLPAFALERDLGNVGLFYSVYGFSLLASRSLSGALSDRIGRGQVVLPSLVMGAVAMLALAAAQSQGALLVVAVLYGVGFAAVQVTVVAIIVDRTPPERLGAGMATYTMAWDVGAVGGGVLLGMLIDATSYSLGFALCAAFPLIGIAVYLAWVRAPRLVAGESAAADVAGEGGSG